MSLAAIKRRVRVGTKLQVVRHDWDFRFPNESEEEHAAKRAAFLAVREVATVTATEVGFRMADGRVSYLRWPESKYIRETENGFVVDLEHTGEFHKVMEYEYR